MWVALAFLGAILLAFGAIFLWYGTMPRFLFLRHTSFQMCRICGDKISEQHTQFLDIGKRKIRHFGQASVYTAFISPQNCAHVYSDYGTKYFSVLTSGLAVTRFTRGFLAGDPLYENKVLSNALSSIAATNSIQARYCLMQLDKQRLAGLTNSLQAALQGTNAALVANLLQSTFQLPNPTN
jgi:hypothetical protein